MAARLLSSQTPSVGVEIDQAHPLARGMVACWIPDARGAFLRSLVPGVAGFTALNSGAPAQSAFGPVVGTAATIAYGTSPTNAAWRPTAAITVVGSLLTRSSASETFGYSCESASGGFGLFFEATTTPSHYMCFNGTFASIDVTTGPTAPNRFAQLAQTYDGATYRAYVDDATNSVAASGPVTHSTNPLILGASNAASASPGGGYCRYFYIYNRALSPAELQALRFAPFQMMRAPKRTAARYGVAAQVVQAARRPIMFVVS